MKASNQLARARRQNEREWLRLCSEVLENTKLSSDKKYINNSNRVKNRIQLDEIINSTFLKFKRDEIIKKMSKAQIAFGKLSSIEDLTNHPQSIFVEIKSLIFLRISKIKNR